MKHIIAISLVAIFGFLILLSLKTHSAFSVLSWFSKCDIVELDRTRNPSGVSEFVTYTRACGGATSASATNVALVKKVPGWFSSEEKYVDIYRASGMKHEISVEWIDRTNIDLHTGTIGEDRIWLKTVKINKVNINYVY